MTAPRITAAADMIRELTRPYATTERVPRRLPVPTTLGALAAAAWTINGTTLHTVMHPPLLTQISHAAHGSSELSDNDAGPTFGSKPPTHLEAITLLERITYESETLATELGCRDSTDLHDRLGAIAGKLATDPHPRVRSWWAAARLLSHWDAPAYRPHNVPCPACWETDTLRIRFDDELAVCTTCGNTWDRTGEPEHGSLDLLGEHVKWCADHEVTKPRHWKIDDDGYPTECTDCLTFRQAWADWRTQQQTATSA